MLKKINTLFFNSLLCCLAGFWEIEFITPSWAKLINQKQINDKYKIIQVFMEN